MASILARPLGREEPLEGVEIRYLRYRHGKNLVVHYEVEIDGVERHAVSITSSKYDLSGEPATPDHRSRAKLVEGRAPAANPFTYEPELRALIYWLPFDPDLPALSEPPSLASPPARARGSRARAGRRRAPPPPVPASTSGHASPRRHVVKIYRHEADFDEGVRGLHASAYVRLGATARCEAVVPEWKLTVQELLPGAPPAGAPTPLARPAPSSPGSMPQTSAASHHCARRPAEGRGRVGEARVGGRADLGRASRSRSCGRLEVGRTSRSTCSCPLTATSTAASSSSWQEELRAHRLRPPWRRRHLRSTSRTTRAPCRPGGARRGSRGVRPRRVRRGLRWPAAGLSWYLSAAILRSARGPFKRFEQDWPERIETTVAAAEAALEL